MVCLWDGLGRLSGNEEAGTGVKCRLILRRVNHYYEREADELYVKYLA